MRIHIYIYKHMHAWSWLHIATRKLIGRSSQGLEAAKSNAEGPVIVARGSRYSAITDLSPTAIPHGFSALFHNGTIAGPSGPMQGIDRRIAGPSRPSRSEPGKCQERHGLFL